MTPEHKAIIIPGLDDRVKPLEWATKGWRKQGLIPIVHSVGWQDTQTSFETKLEKLLVVIDSLVENGETISLVGPSAGAIAALHVFLRRRKEIHRVINVCGRINTGSPRGFRSLENRARKSPAFLEAVKLFENQESKLDDADRARIMTVRARFGDQLVPADTTVLYGASNISIPTIEHVLSIYASLTVFSRPLMQFLKSNSL